MDMNSDNNSDDNVKLQLFYNYVTVLIHSIYKGVKLQLFYIFYV